MSFSLPPGLSQEPTELAIKYGAYGREDHPQFPQLYLRSGLTPLNTLFPANPNNLSEQDKTGRALNEKIMEIQKEKLCGFTSRELVDLDVYTTRELKAGDLDNPMIPMLSLDNWEKKAFRQLKRQSLPSLGSAGNGPWKASNALIYAQLEIPLRLASRILTSIHLVPWVRLYLFVLNLNLIGIV
jgi:hypothetical protein